MKKSLLLLFLLLTYFMYFGQAPKRLSEVDSIKIEMQVVEAVHQLEKKLQKDERGNEYLTKIFIEFSMDTFKIEERQKLQMDVDYSTSGMIAATIRANGEYDKLLNKYYQLLLSRLEEQDKEVFRQAQRNWVSYRDAELELNYLLTENKYSGGGSIQGIIVAYRSLDLTRKRVIELYHYLGRMYE